MNIIEGIILGAVQGLTEFIPVSSSGHLVIVESLMNGHASHLFLEYINIGTVMALIVYFWPKIRAFTIDAISGRDRRMAVRVIISTLPAGIIGFTFADFIESTSFFGNVWVVVASLFFVGLLMVLIDKIARKPLLESGQQISKARALAIGFAQAAALVPGVSRSGATIIAGRLAGLNSAAAAEYSFLMSIPIMLGVAVKLFASSEDRAYLFDNIEVLVLSNVAAFLCGILTVSFLMKYLSKHGLKLFGWYRIILASIIACALVVGYI